MGTFLGIRFGNKKGKAHQPAIETGLAGGIGPILLLVGWGLIGKYKEGMWENEMCGK